MKFARAEDCDIRSGSKPIKLDQKCIDGLREQQLELGTNVYTSSMHTLKES